MIAVLLEQDLAHVWVCIVLETRHGGPDVTKGIANGQGQLRRIDVLTDTNVGLVGRNNLA